MLHQWLQQKMLAPELAEPVAVSDEVRMVIEVGQEGLEAFLERKTPILSLLPVGQTTIDSVEGWCSSGHQVLVSHLLQ